jgi:hypothetical protein
MSNLTGKNAKNRILGIFRSSYAAETLILTYKPAEGISFNSGFESL